MKDSIINLFKVCDKLNRERGKYFPWGKLGEHRTYTRAIVHQIDMFLEKNGIPTKEEAFQIWNHAEENGWRGEWNICILNANF